MAITVITKMSGFLLTDFNKKAKEIRRKRRAWNLAAVVETEKWIKQNFVAAGTKHESGSLHWKRLSPATIAMRREGGGSGTPQILRDTGNLMNRWERSATASAGVLKSKQNYSATHEFGQGRVPQRKIFPTAKQGREIVKPVYEALLRKTINRR